jgi:tRNA(fMet)-specific endonuclease VapC
MEAKRVLDTDTLIEFLRDNAKVVHNVAAYLQHHQQLSFAIVSYYELLRGLSYIKATRQLQSLEQLVVDSEILPLNMSAIRIAADIYATLRRQGNLIPDGDLFIAATALAHDCVLVTNNIAHFERIPNLRLDNWR